MPQDNQYPRCFVVTTPGLSATRWLAYVLAEHPDVYVAHGKHALDAVIRGQFTQEQQNGDRDSLVRGNAMQALYDKHSLEAVFTRYQQTKPEARVFGCVHSYTLDGLVLAARSPQTLSNLRILNLVRHPVSYIASHYALVRSAEKYPRLYQLYVERVFPQALRAFPELFLMPCSDTRTFLAFAASCLGVANLIRDLVFPGVRSVKMEELTTRIELLQSVCQELTGLTYSHESLRTFLSRGAVNQHRPQGASKDPHAIFAGWEPWQQDMAQVMVSGAVLDWLEDMGYDVTMLRSGSPTSGRTNNAPLSEPPVPCLGDHLRMLDQRHPYLEHLTQPGRSKIQFIETEHQGFQLVHQDGKVYALAKSLKGQDPRRLTPEALRELKVKGSCFCADTVAEVWMATARKLFPNPELVAAQTNTTTPRLIEEGFNEFNLVGYGGKVFALAQCVGPTDFTRLSDIKLEELRSKEQIYVADSLEEAKDWIEQLQERLLPRTLKPAYKGFNLVAYRGNVWAVAQALGPLDLTSLAASDIEEHERTARIFVAPSAEEAKRWIDQIRCPSRRRRLLSRIYRRAVSFFC
jgi:hypothetical protein